MKSALFFLPGVLLGGLVSSGVIGWRGAVGAGLVFAMWGISVYFPGKPRRETKA